MKPQRVLVADRNPAFLEKTAEILASASVGMIPIDNGGRVLTLCRHEQPDAVLLHVDLPALPGTEVCQRIKTQLDAALPVVLMFPEERPNLDELASRCLADNFLVRPLKRTELLFCVRSLVQLRRLLQEKAAAGLAPAPAIGRGGMVGLDIFFHFLRLEIQRVERYGFPLAVLSVGLDPLPEEASTWGKSLESQLGPALAESMRSSLRDIDLCAVLSHREMLAIMPHTDVDGARIAAQRICQTISAQSYHFGRTRIQPTVSVGLSCVHGEAISSDELIERVKGFRTQASSEGGNRVLTG
jgi:two-component system, cell cycle response regulator